jgi:hypothetical protein
VDDAGAPVPGLLLGLLSDNPYLQDFKRDKAVVAIEFTIPLSTRVVVRVEDVLGDPVTTLVDGELVAGRHQVVWNGRDGAGVHQPSGRYAIRMIAVDPAAENGVFEDTIDALMCLLDPEQAPVGVTDAEGRIVLDDARLFPHFFEREPMEAVDENGEIQGVLQPTAAMVFSLADTANGGLMIFREEVERRSSFQFVWRAIAPAAAGREPKAAEEKDTIPPPPVFRLGPVYPNPFN